ncbi:MAG: inositol monophosphatase family protein [Lentisphaeria bacterium]
MTDKLLSIVKEAGELSFHYFGQLAEQDVKHKKDVADLVTPVDREVEEFLRSRLAREFPEVPFIGEEGEYGNPADYDTAFIVDPIDGTTNFVHALPEYAVSVGFKKDGRLATGAVYLPYFKTMYHAVRGHGAYKDGRSIRVSASNELNKALVCTGFACIRENLPDNNIALFNRVLPEVRAVRGTGAAAVECCYVAEGRYDLYWELNLKPWDVAAGTLIVREAGGKVTDLQGSEEFDETASYVASNGPVHNKFLELAKFR